MELRPLEASTEPSTLPPAVRAALWRGRVEVDLDALDANVRAVRRLLSPGTRLLAVVKGDAYGLGAVEVARVLLDAGSDWLGTATPEAAVALREAGIRAPVLVFNPPLDESQAELWVRYDLRAMAGDAATLAALSRAAQRLGRPVVVHLEVDLGFGRFGTEPDQAVSLLHHARQLPDLVVEGLAAHLPAARRPKDALRRLSHFRRLVARVEAAGLRPPLVHCAESALLLLAPDAQFDLVRVGNLLYGLNSRAARSRGVDVRDPWRLVARVLAVKEIGPGGRPGYAGCRRWYTRRFATLGVGLGDGVGYELPVSGGLPAHLARWLRRIAAWLGVAAGTPAVRVGKRTFPLRGEFMMDHCLIDAGRMNLRPGDEVELLVPRLALTGQLPVVYLRRGVAVAVSWPARERAALPSRRAQASALVAEP